MRRFVIVGQRATSSPEFSLTDIAGTSGRLDVLLRCLRSALLVSHGLRADTTVYLVLQGGPLAPRSVRFDGATARFIRPDERALAVLVQKVLAIATEGPAFQTVRPGIALAAGGLASVLDDLGALTAYVLEEGAPDVRTQQIDSPNAAFFVGDHLGFDAPTREHLRALSATPLGLGPVSVHAEDAVTLLHNELDRRS